MNDKKKQAIEILKNALRTTKAQIDPNVLKKAQEAVVQKQQKQENAKNTEPYDKKNAAEAIALFLNDSPDAKDKFLALLKNEKKN